MSTSLLTAVMVTLLVGNKELNCADFIRLDELAYAENLATVDENGDIKVTEGIEVVIKTASKDHYTQGMLVCRVQMEVSGKTITLLDKAYGLLTEDQYAREALSSKTPEQIEEIGVLMETFASVMQNSEEDMHQPNTPQFNSMTTIHEDLIVILIKDSEGFSVDEIVHLPLSGSWAIKAFETNKSELKKTKSISREIKA